MGFGQNFEHSCGGRLYTIYGYNIRESLRFRLHGVGLPLINVDLDEEMIQTLFESLGKFSGITIDPQRNTIGYNWNLIGSSSNCSLSVVNDGHIVLNRLEVLELAEFLRSTFEILSVMVVLTE